MKYVPELDALRGLAAVAVVALHWSPTVFFWGWSGVNLFFVLSGYLIGSIVLGALLEGRFSIIQFYYHRTLRIWPVYYLSLFMILAFHLAVHGFSFFQSEYFGDWLRSLVFLQFTEFYATPGIASEQIFNFLPGMLPIWSLAVEEQFYLILPALLMMLLSKIGIGRTTLVLFAIALVAPVMRLSGFVPVLLVTQMDGLMFGVILAAITLRNSDRQLLSRMTVRVLFLCSIIGSLFLLAPYLYRGFTDGVGAADVFAEPLLWTWADIFFFGVIGLVVTYTNSPLLALLRVRPLLYLGSISYAVYMFHFPILSYVKPRLENWLGDDFGWLSAIVTAALIVGLSHLSRECLERPILSLKSRIPGGRTSAAGEAS